jgi:hypothetical protein
VVRSRRLGTIRGHDSPIAPFAKPHARHLLGSSKERGDLVSRHARQVIHIAATPTAPSNRVRASHLVPRRFARRLDVDGIDPCRSRSTQLIIDLHQSVFEPRRTLGGTFRILEFVREVPSLSNQRLTSIPIRTTDRMSRITLLL